MGKSCKIALTCLIKCFSHEPNQFTFGKSVDLARTWKKTVKEVKIWQKIKYNYSPIPTKFGILQFSVFDMFRCISKIDDLAEVTI